MDGYLICSSESTDARSSTQEALSVFSLHAQKSLVLESLVPSILCLLVVHSFILDISIVPLQIYYYSEALPTTALILCRS